MKRRTLHIFLIFAICFAIISLIFHLLTYFPYLRTSKSPIIFLLGAAIFPPFYVGLKSNQNLADKNNPMGMWDDILKGTPPYQKVLVVLTIPYVIFNFFYSLIFLTKGLSPDILNNAYVLTTKVKVVEEISETEYFNYVAYEFRGISGHFIFFQLISISLISSALHISKRKDINEKKEIES